MAFAVPFGPSVVDTLMTWFMDNIKDPFPGRYPEEMIALMEATDLKERQVIDWMINARARFRKPFLGLCIHI